MNAENRQFNSAPVALCILDGWGLSDDRESNAVALAHTPHFDALWEAGPRTTLTASGLAVGLPDGQMGNSEVGHMNIGAGRVVLMDLPKIDASIEQGEFQTRPNMLSFIEATQGGVVHLLGMMSTGGVHAHQRHLIAAIRTFHAAGLSIKLHLLLDGRDTPPKSALADLDALESAVAGMENVSVATVVGRFYALDRDNRWERVEAAYNAVALGKAHFVASSAREAIEAAYARGESDEFVQATRIDGYTGIEVGDSLFMTHFRADRAREILSALLAEKFDGFERAVRPSFAAVLGMVEYSDELNAILPALFPQENLVNTLGDWVSNQGIAQFRVAETEKYPHVTFFFNGGVETPNTGEARFMAPSPKVATYDLAPEMSADAVSAALRDAVLSGEYGLIVANFANPDMVGHTGDLKAAIAAVEAVDRGLGAFLEAVRAVGGAALVTADHGNCEVMVDPTTLEPHTAHTTNPVPLVLLDARANATPCRLESGGRLADIAPTLLTLMEVPQPVEMSGRSLIKVD